MSDCDLLIFDCDGVLVDSEIIANRVGAELKTELGYPTTLEEQVRKFAGMGLNSAEVLAEHARLPSNYRALFAEKLRYAYERELKAIDGVVETILGLRKPFCVASSSMLDSLTFKLRHVGLAEAFGDRVFSGQFVKNGKPAPDLFLLAAERMGVAPVRCLVIEDSVPGVQAARAAGMTAYGFTGAAHADPDLRERLISAGAARVYLRMAEMGL